MHACIVNTSVAYTKPETCCVVILLINQAIEKKGLDHHLLCSMQCHINGVVINGVPNFLAPAASETMHAIQLENLFDATHAIIIPLKLNRVTSYFEVRTPTQEEHEKKNILRIECMVKAPLWDQSSPKLSRQKQSLLITGDNLSAPKFQ